jgi:hypothetical protein
MASRILNRRRLRGEADHVGTAAPAGEAAAPAAPKPRKSRAKKAPPRMRARWGVFDAGMKQVAVFDYKDRAAAQDKLAQLCARNKGPHFLQIVKEPMPEPGAEEAPPRAAARARAAKK